MHPIRSFKPVHLLPVVLGAVLITQSAFLQAGNLTQSQYATDFSSITKITRDLHGALEDKNQSQVTDQLILHKQAGLPYMAPAIKGNLKTVTMSESCVRLLNQVSHAKAIDDSVGGFFQDYMNALSSVSGGSPLPALSQVDEKTAWSLDTVNLQKSHFNQIVGTLVAIEMSHHYLGHYDKYAKDLKAGTGHPAAINRHLSKKEWRNAVLKGARNALDCGLGVDGLIAFYSGIEQMKDRPEWTLYFLPESANVGKINKALKKMENSFFLVDY